MQVKGCLPRATVFWLLDRDLTAMLPSDHSNATNGLVG